MFLVRKAQSCGKSYLYYTSYDVHVSSSSYDMHVFSSSLISISGYLVTDPSGKARRLLDVGRIPKDVCAVDVWSRRACQHVCDDDALRLRIPCDRPVRQGLVRRLLDVGRPLYSRRGPRLLSRWSRPLAFF